MKGFMAQTLNTIRGLAQAFQLRRLLAVVLVGFFLLTTQADAQSGGFFSKARAERVSSDFRQSETRRPQTTGEWMHEAKQDVPLNERVKDITEESAEAFKDFGSMYVDGAKKAGEQIKEGVEQATH